MRFVEILLHQMIPEHLRGGPKRSNDNHLNVFFFKRIYSSSDSTYLSEITVFSVIQTFLESCLLIPLHQLLKTSTVHSSTSKS